jgi:hypothetical protein
MIDRSVARDERGIFTEMRDAEEDEQRQESLYDVLAAFPLIERVELIERMAERMVV